MPSSSSDAMTEDSSDATVDAFAEIEREVGLRAAHALDPSPVGVDRNASELVAVAGQHGLDRFDRLEDGEVGRFTKCRDAIEEDDDFHLNAPFEISI